MSFWGKIFGSDSVIEKATDGIYNGVDSIVYTDQEKAERLERMLKLYEPFKLAQRLIALAVGAPFVTIHTIVCLVWIASVFVVGDSVAYEFVKGEMAAIASSNNETLGTPFTVIVAFYFAGGAGEGIINAQLNKMRLDTKSP